MINMFDNIGFYDIVGTGDPAMSNFIMTSAELTDQLIEDFKNWILQGYDPDDVKYTVFAERGVSTDDLTDLDKERLKETIISYWEAYQ